jgi:hypothetical protein
MNYLRLTLKQSYSLAPDASLTSIVLIHDLKVICSCIYSYDCVTAVDI